MILTTINYFENIDQIMNPVYIELIYDIPFNYFHILNFDFLDNRFEHYFVTKTLFLNTVLETSEFSTNLENTKSIYHYSIPTVKMFYPEPFIAAASFMHNDLWFIHILVYQYWLWFVFIFIIVFFIITFLCIVRWCNMRTRPRRETRGVSRSKCGDLITATVPVSWAASIIISESTDAIDYFDGFGTTEMVIGIRAYQWGWEYYYPKDIDLNYNVQKNYSAFFGKSLKYQRSTDLNIHSNKAWKFYQNKPYDFVVVPSHLLLLPTDNYKILNYLNFSDVGTNAFHDSALFKHTRMFSKTFSANLVNNITNFHVKYNQLSPLFFSELDLQDSHHYGLKRQHNFINSKVVTNNFTTLFNLKNVTKLFSFNYFTNFTNSNTFKGKLLINFFKPFTSHLTLSSWLSSNIFTSLYFSQTLFKYNKHLTFLSLIDTLNNDSDKKMLKKVSQKLITLSPKNIKLNNSNNFLNLNLNNNVLSHLTLNDQFFNNDRLTKKFSIPFSSNQSIPKSAQSIKNFANLNLTNPTFNFNSKLNANATYSDFVNSKLNINVLTFKTINKIKWIDPQASFKLLHNKIYFDSPTPAFTSNLRSNSLLNYDKFIPSEEETTFISHQTREDLVCEPISRTYWNFFFAQTDLNWRLKNTYFFNKLHNSFYLPFFTFGQDYDFQNWQGLIYLEDAFWENFISTYSIDDYLTFSDTFNETIYIDKTEKTFNFSDRDFDPNAFILAKPYTKDLSTNVNHYSSYIYSEELLNSPDSIPSYLFVTYPVSTNTALSEESFEFIKNISQIREYSTQFSFFFTNSFFNNHTNYFVVDNFRANTEDFTWLEEDKIKINLFTDNFDMQKCDFKLVKNLELNYKLFNNIKSYDLISNPLLFLISTDIFNFQKTIRVSNFLDLRSSTRSLASIYNSYQKVYKPRLDENRSHAKTVDIANLAVKQPNLTAPKSKIERSLGKNKHSFFQNYTYKNEILNNFNVLYDAFTSLNYYFFDFPFLMSLKSDASRYFWTDWFARWGMYEVQPASSSRYLLTGVPFFNKNFDYTADLNAEISDAENYFTRLTRARKNYMPTWTHIPFHTTRNLLSHKNNVFYETYKITSKPLKGLKNFLTLSHCYWQSTNIISIDSTHFFGSHSNLTSYSRANWSASNKITTYYSTISIFLDTLTKREYLYREFLSSKKFIYTLSTEMLNNPNISLLKDLKVIFMMANPTNFNVEYSRELYYNSLDFYDFTTIKPTVISFFKSLGFSSNLISTFLNLNNTDITTNSTEPYVLDKSQYRPMKRGINNMIRLHGTGAIAMPIEIRLQVLASSKDVIHSWAVPSAGVKIDCVPGYSSHRVIIFLVSGIFWGQCMEICGRYHHWMPIIVYFMKRDLFFLWCSHFVFLSGANNMWVINDRQFTNYGRNVSFNKTSWIKELK